MRSIELSRDGHVVALGAIDGLITVDDAMQWNEHTWKPAPTLFYAPSRRILFWLTGYGKSKWKREAMTGEAAAKFREWSRRESEHTTTLKIPDVDMRSIGRATQIEYTSDKWGGKKKEYVHEFSRAVKAYRYERGSKELTAVRGGRMTVNDRGIVY